MSKKLFIKPAKGLKVRDPLTMKHVPETGLEVTDSTYWRRRLAAGDVKNARKSTTKKKGGKS